MKKLLSIVLSLVLVLGFSITAFAAVAFDAATGTGFVGKGDVQLAFGWNNKDAQTKTPGVTFTYNKEEKYLVTEEWETSHQKEVKTHEVTKKTTCSVNSVIQYEPRVKNQITGYLLNGFSSVIEEGTVPQIGDIVVDPQTGNPYPSNHTVSAVDLVSSTGGLYVNYNGTSVALPNTPVVTTVQ